MTLTIFPGNISPIMFYKDQGIMGFSFQRYQKVMEHLYYGYPEPVEMSNYLLLVLRTYSFLNSARRGSIHRILRYPSADNEMVIIEQDRPESIREETWREVLQVMKHTTAFQVNQNSPRTFFSVKGTINAELHHVFQIGIMSLRRGNILHVVRIWIWLRDVVFTKEMDAEGTGRALRLFSNIVFVGPPHYIHTGAETNFKLSVLVGRTASYSTVTRTASTTTHEWIGVI